MNSQGASGPVLECDLVMKGGITSGVIYPKLIATLSDTYRFRSIGGTSAGAIAAAAAAAAQLGVHARTNPDAFELLARLPEQLGKPVGDKHHSMLLGLFQPQKRLARHFKLLTAALNAKSNAARARRVATAAVQRFPIAALLGAAPGIILLFQSRGLVGQVISLVYVLVGALVVALIQALLSFGKELPSNYFGLCNGMEGSAKGTSIALTPWLHGYMNALAGKRVTEPLTFGELWRGSINKNDDVTAGEASGVLDVQSPDAPVIELAMITTAVNLGRPYRLPFDIGDIYYIEEELAKFFPEEVMRWLVSHARPSKTADSLIKKGSTFRAFPIASDFPIVVGVRLSLSFPLLLSALPLYTVDRTLDVNKEKPTRATRVYFSDGGVSSNFPVHFFDNPLPSRPTFGVNLKDFHPDHPTERVFLPGLLRNNTGLKNHCPPLPSGPGWQSIAAFVAALVSTMQNWRDHLQLSMPGFRDRIVHISHSETEGGLNLNMPPEVIAALATSGAEAAKALIDTFAVGGGLEAPNGWDNHRRIRARALLSALQRQLTLIGEATKDSLKPSYDEVILDDTPPSYRFPKQSDAIEAQKLLHELAELANDLVTHSVNFSAGAPRPAPDLRMVSRV